MKILLCHNYYRVRGGEDQSFDDEAFMLQEAGHEVVRFTVHSNDASHLGPVRMAFKTIWNGHTYRALRAVLRRERPAVMHCTNTFPFLSPSAYYAARAEGVPVVQSLRNYRLACLNSSLMRSNRICETCLQRRIPWPGVRHACYRDSHLASAAVAAMLVVHRAAGTWRNHVACFYTPSEFARRKLLEAGLPPDRLFVKPNFVHPDPGPGSGRGGYAVFAGRLFPGKGIETMLDAWGRLENPIRLRIVGEGPLAATVCFAAAQSPWIQYLGVRSHREVLELMGDASFVVFPSQWYETFGRIIVEAYAKGTPVVASRLGAIIELVQDGRTGWLFEPGNVPDLVDKLRHAMAVCAPEAAIRTVARQAYLQDYTAAANLSVLLDIYRRAIACQDVCLSRTERAVATCAPANRRFAIRGRNGSLPTH